MSLIAGPNGNITSSFPKELDPIVYNPFTQMTKSITVSGSPTHTVNFQYTADNERILKSEKQGTTNNSNLYIRGASEYPVIEKINTNNTLTDKIYIYGPTGLIAFKDATATYFVIKDHLGSTRVLFRSTGSQYTTYDYSPFGSLMRATINGDVDYRFTGQEYDSEFGLYNFRARLYDDEIGIFYAVDPAGQNFSPFSYAGNNPVMYVDKDGRFWFLPIIIGAAIGGGISGIAYSAFAGGDWTWSGFGNAVLGGAIAGGLSAIGGAFISNATLGMLNQTLSYTASSAIMGQDITATGVIGSLVGGGIAGSIPAFQGVKGGSWIENGIAEMFYGSMKTGIGGGLGGGITSLLEGGSFSSGFEAGFKRGVVTGAVTTGLTMFIMGTAIHPDGQKNSAAIEGMAEMEADMSLVGNGMGIYKPTYRGGGLLQWIDKFYGQAFGTDLHIGFWDYNDTYHNDLFIHETSHYYQMTSIGWGNMVYKVVSQYLQYGNNVYNTPGTIEWASKNLFNIYLKR